MIKAQGYEPLITHVFRAGGPYLDSDAVFGVRSSLIAEWIRHEPGSPQPDGMSSSTAFYTLNYDFKLYHVGSRTQQAIDKSTGGARSTFADSSSVNT
jgi:hydroxyquinol 1,2-dioxygenase